MKKTYCKPIIMFENFTLSTKIAGDCEVKISNQSRNSCAYIEKFGKNETSFFTDAVGACLTTEQDGEGHDGLCYHVPGEAYNIFNS